MNTPETGVIEIDGGTPDEQSAIRARLTMVYQGRLVTRVERVVNGWRVRGKSLMLPAPGVPEGVAQQTSRVGVEEALMEGGFSVVNDNSFKLTADQVMLFVHRESTSSQRATLQEFLHRVADSWGNLRIDITLSQDHPWAVATLGDPQNWDPRERSLARRVPNPREIVISAFEAFGIKAASAGPFVFSRRADLVRDAPEEVDYP